MTMTKTDYGKFFVLVFVLFVMLAGAQILGVYPAPLGVGRDRAALAASAQVVIPEDGVALPIYWGDIGMRMTAAGVMDPGAFEALYASRGGVGEQAREMLNSNYTKPVVIDQENAGELLNLFWAVGLGNRNPILESKEEMQNPAHGGAERFASTGGWPLARGSAMEHYSAHALVTLTPEEQALLERVSAGIYRPCCGNSAHFPDCNHGMAMLGLLEFMVSQGVSEADMYRYALVVNSYWFPDTYLTIAQYLAKRGTDWEEADPKEILGYRYSSAEGYRRVLAEVAPAEGGSASCSV